MVTHYREPGVKEGTSVSCGLVPGFGTTITDDPREADCARCQTTVRFRRERYDLTHDQAIGKQKVRNSGRKDPS